MQQNTSGGFSITSSFFQLVISPEAKFIYYTFWTVVIGIMINIYNKNWFFLCLHILTFCGIYELLNLVETYFENNFLVHHHYYFVDQTDLKKQNKRLYFSQIHGLIRLSINPLSKYIGKINKIKQTIKDQKYVYVNTSRQCWTACVWGELSESNKLVIFWPLPDKEGFIKGEPVLQKFYVDFDCCWLLLSYSEFGS